MKLFYLFLLGALSSLTLKANSPEFVDRHPMALKGEMQTSPTKKANIQKVTEEARSIVMNSPVVASEETTGYSLEGEWHFKMEGELYDDLTETMIRKAKLLPFAKDRTIVPVLFLKTPSGSSSSRILLPSDICNLSY